MDNRPEVDTGCVEACIPSGMQMNSWGNGREVVTVGDPFVYNGPCDFSEVTKLDKIVRDL